MTTAERLRELLHYNPETGVFTWVVKRRGVRVGAMAGTVSSTNGYRIIRLDYRAYQAHRLAWLWMVGGWPKGQIDHLNCNKVDNRWCNLREATPTQNTRNRPVRRDNRIGFKGVARANHRWQARIWVNGKRFHIGCFDSPEDAHNAYAAAAKEYFGEFARVNG